METLEKPLDLKVKVVKEEACLVTFSVEVDKKEVAEETERVYQNIQSRASLPGFRTGKAPIDLVRKNFTGRAQQTVLENLVSRSAAQVLREKKLETIDTPQVEKLSFEPGKPLSFHMKVEKDPAIKVKDYKGIKINQKPTTVTDDQVRKTLEELLERNASLIQSAAETVGKNNFVVIDFEGKIDGKVFQGGSSKNYLLEMGTPQMIAGFSEGIVGAKANETRSVSAKFPADYAAKEFAGKEAVFQVTVKEIKEKKKPALDDEFAKDLGLASLAELQTKVRESLEKEATQRSDKETEDQLFQGLLDKNIFDVPPSMVEHRTQNLIKRNRSMLERQGLKLPNDPKGEEAIRDKVRPQAEKDVRLSYLLKGIAEQEKLEDVTKEFDELKQKALSESQDKKDAVENYFKEHLVSIRASLLESKVIEFLKKNAKIKTVTE